MRAIDIHTHPILRDDGRGRAEADKLIARAQSHGIEHLVALGDVLAYGRSPSEAQLRKINEVVDTLVRKESYCAECANELLKYVSSLLAREK